MCLANRDQIVATLVAGPAVTRAPIQRIHPVSARHREAAMRGA